MAEEIHVSGEQILIGSEGWDVGGGLSFRTHASLGLVLLLPHLATQLVVLLVALGSDSALRLLHRGSRTATGDTFQDSGWVVVAAT